MFIIHSYLSQLPCVCVCVRTGLRDWYLRNTIGSNHQSQVSGKVNPGVSAKVNGGVKGQPGGGGALQIRRKTIGVVQQPTYQTDTTHHQAPPHRKQMLPHSATFHGHPLHGRSGITFNELLSQRDSPVPLLLHACAPQPDLSSPPSQVCGRRSLPGRLPRPETGNTSPRPDPGPPVSWNFGVTNPRLAPWGDWRFCWDNSRTLSRTCSSGVP